MKRMKLLMALLVTAFVSLASQTVSADNSMNYVVSPQMPDNQIDKTLGFYNLQGHTGVQVKPCMSRCRISPQRISKFTLRLGQPVLQQRDRLIM